MSDAQILFSTSGKFPETGPAKIFYRARNLSASRRGYRLSVEGRAAKQESIRIHQPWQKATGPRTSAGKRRSSKNGLRNRRLWRIDSRQVIVESDGIVSEIEIRTTYANGRTTIRRSVRIHFRRMQVERRRLERAFEQTMRRFTEPAR